MTLPIGRMGFLEQWYALKCKGLSLAECDMKRYSLPALKALQSFPDWQTESLIRYLSFSKLSWTAETKDERKTRDR